MTPFIEFDSFGTKIEIVYLSDEVLYNPTTRKEALMIIDIVDTLNFFANAS